MIERQTTAFLSYSGTNLSEEAQLRCAAARTFEEIEDFARTRESLGFLFDLDEETVLQLDEPVRADVFLRVGSLMRRIAGRVRIVDEQEKAKAHLLRALELFKRLGNIQRAAETVIALASSYWNIGSYAQSRSLLNDPLFSLCDDMSIKADRLFLFAILEREEKRYHEAISLHRQLDSLYGQLGRSARICRYRGEFANALLLLGEKENNSEYINEAFLNYIVASQEAEEVGNYRYAGFVRNNVGYIFFKRGRLAEAWENLAGARRIFEGLQDVSCVAQVDETRAQVLNAQGQYQEAATLLRRSIRIFEITGEAAQLAAALVTLSATYIGLEQGNDAEACATRAVEIYVLNEAAADEGRAQLALAEALALRPSPPFGKLLQSFIRATKLLAIERDDQVTERLKLVEGRLVDVSIRDVHRSPKLEVARQPVAGTVLWDEGLTLEEAKARVEEWYLARLILEHGTLAPIARALNLSIEGARKKIALYPHLEALKSAMRDSKITPLARRKGERRLDKIRLDDEDNYLRARGPCGGDTLGVEECERLKPTELGVIEYCGETYIGYLNSTGNPPMFDSGHVDYPSFPLEEGAVYIVGRVQGYWRAGEEKMRPLKKLSV